MRSAPLKVALTGGIGAGKSAALSAFERAGAETISLDAITHELSRKGRPVRRAILGAFGAAVLDHSGEIDRRALADLVFSKPGMLRKLERATHPPILREMRRRLKTCRKAVVVVDVPLLFEGGLQKEFDLSVLLTAPRTQRLARVMRRDGVTRARAEARMKAQMPTARKRALADIEIANEKSLQALRRTVTEYQKAFDLIASGIKQTLRRRS